MVSARREPGEARNVALIGAGLIGASWAAYFLARGYEVAAHDPDPGAPSRVDAHVRAVWPTLEAAGLVKTSRPGRAIKFAPIEEACGSADIVIECGPEDLDLKRDMIGAIDRAAPAEAIIASSSSALMPSDYQISAANPQRVLGAHPFNPPALVPLVEIVAGKATDPCALAWVLDFFKSAGKRAVHVKLEQPGFLANRMASALYREAVDLVARGVASVADVDAAICNGPGLRWALMGPHLLYHLGGGAGGYRAYLEHLGPSQEARWASLKTTTLTEEVRDALVEGVREESDALGGGNLAAKRDRLLAQIIALLAEQEGSGA